MHTIHGIPVVNGLAYAPAVWVTHPQIPPLDDKLDDETIPVEQRDSEMQRYRRAARLVSQQLLNQSEETVGNAADILLAQSRLADDAAYRKKVGKAIAAGVPAPVAVRQSTEALCAKFREHGGVFAQRNTDLLDIARRVIAELLGGTVPATVSLDSPAVLLCDDLAPSDAASLNPRLVQALVMRLGGADSHTSIIARQLGIPCLVAVADLPLVENGEMVFVDATSGSLTVEPDPDTLRRLKAGDSPDHSGHGGEPARLASGEVVKLFATVWDSQSAKKAKDYAPGVGLFQTEKCFLGTSDEPSVKEQAAFYGEVMSVFDHQLVVTRTLDWGSDSGAPWAGLGKESNPALGVLGLRVAGVNCGLFTRQLEAIGLAARQHAGETWVVAPMVSTLAEARWVASQARSRGLTPGITVEVPAAAIMIDRFLDVVDFVFVNAGGLAQYVMAADSGDARLAAYADSWQPAVLALISQVAGGGRAKNKPVLVGEAVADPALACVLVGMGVSFLSMEASGIPDVRGQLGRVTLAQCQEAAAAVVRASDAGDARARARQALNG